MASAELAKLTEGELDGGGGDDAVGRRELAAVVSEEVLTLITSPVEAVDGFVVL